MRREGTGGRLAHAGRSLPRARPTASGARAPTPPRLLHRLRRAERDVGRVGLALVAARLLASAGAARAVLDRVGADADVTAERGALLDDQLGGAEVAFV